MDLHTWLIYLLAAIGLSLSPGPNGLLALTQGAVHGARRCVRVRGGDRAVDVRHWCTAAGVAHLAHGDEVGRRPVPGVARHPGVACAADRPGDERGGHPAARLVAVPSGCAV